MTYYNYHAQIKKLINSNHLTQAQAFLKWKNVGACVVLFFDNHKPMPIRENSFATYSQHALIAQAIDEYFNLTQFKS